MPAYEPEEEYRGGQTHITKFLSGDYKKKIINIKLKRHPKSMLKDESIPMKKVADGESIFDIIMPWWVEQQKLDKKNKKKK